MEITYWYWLHNDEFEINKMEKLIAFAEESDDKNDEIKCGKIIDYAFTHAGIFIGSCDEKFIQTYNGIFIKIYNGIKSRILNHIMQYFKTYNEMLVQGYIMQYLQYIMQHLLNCRM